MAQRPSTPPADPAARKIREGSENEAVEGKAKPEAGGGKPQDDVEAGPGREEWELAEPPPPAERPDRDAPTFHIRLVFQVVPADTPVAAEVRAGESAGPEASMEAAEAIDEPPLAAPVEAAPAEAAPAAQE